MPLPPPDRNLATDGPLWARGDMMFRVRGAGREGDRLIKIRRPFALVGQPGESDVGIGDPAVAARHAYLHLDPRGLYAVDLLSRTGTRINGTDRMIGWLRPGDWVEVAGRRVELLRIRIGGAKHDPPPCDADLLAESGAGPGAPPLVGLTLEPRRPGDCPWVIGSELVVLGGSPSCGIQVRDSSVARTHCALVRTATAAFAVDLSGRGTWIGRHPLRGATALSDGDILTLGASPFRVRIEPAPPPPAAARHPATGAALPARRNGSHPDSPPPAERNGALLARVEPLPDFPPDVGHDDSRRELLAWLMGTIQGGQGEILRQQGEFQVAMTRLLHQLQHDNAALLNAHLARIERVDRELADLRAEIGRRDDRPAPDDGRGHSPALPRPRPTPPPVAPLNIARTVPENANPQASTTWLLERVSQLESENRSAWKDLLARLAP